MPLKIDVTLNEQSSYLSARAVLSGKYSLLNQKTHLVSQMCQEITFSLSTIHARANSYLESTPAYSFSTASALEPVNNKIRGASINFAPFASPQPFNVREGYKTARLEDRKKAEPSHASPIPLCFADVAHIVRDEIYHHAPHLVKTLPIQIFRFLGAYSENSDSDRPIRNTIIDITAEGAFVWGLSGLIGGGVAGALMLEGHIVDHLKSTFPAPSWEEIGDLATSRNPVDRELAQAYIQAKASAEILSAPATVVHRAAHAARNIIDAFQSPSGEYYFPPKEALATCLNSHRLLAHESYFKEKKVVEKMAEAFGDETKTEEEVTREILRILSEIGTLRVAINPSLLNLKKSAVDCAK